MSYVTRFVYAVFVFLAIVLAFDYFPRPGSDLLAEIDSHHRSYRRGGRDDFNNIATKYFKIGMSIDECKNILISKNVNFREVENYKTKGIGFSKAIAVGLNYSMWNPLNWRHGLLTSIEHYITLGFDDGRLVYINTSSHGLGL